MIPQGWAARIARAAARSTRPGARRATAHMARDSLVLAA